MKKFSSILLFLLCVSAIVAQNGIQSEIKKTTVDPIFNIEEILDESTLDIKILEDWHVDEPTSSTRQKLIEINVAEWWSGQDFRIPVRMIVPLEGKAKGFFITGANPYETLMKDAKPSDFDAKLLANGVGIVKTHVKRVAKIPGKQGQLKEMEKLFMEDPNPRYTQVWIWSMTLMRAATAAYAETDHFEKGKVAGAGSSKNGIAPAVALINDERFTATCSNHAFAYYSPFRRADREVIAKAEDANKAFFEAVKAGDIDLDQKRSKLFQRVMVGSKSSMDKMALKAGISLDEMQNYADRFWQALCVTENWDRLMERGVDVFFEPGTHDYVAFDILWGAQNHPQLPVYYQPNGGHSQTPHIATAKDEQNKEAFLWHHFFGGEPMLKPPTSSHIVDKDKLSVSVSFNEGPQPISGRIWWIYDRDPAGSAPFLQVQIPEDQWMDMEYDAKTGAWTAAIPLEDGFSRIDFFSNHGLEVNGYKQYLSSPYTRAEWIPLAITSSPAENIIAGETYSYSIETEGEGALFFESSPEADWLSLENSILNGTPQYEDAGTFDVIVAYSNELDTVKQAFTISVTIPLSINSTPMESAIVGEAYIYTIETTGEGSLSFTTLPHADWLSLSENILSGMPEVADTGTVNVSILFKDGSDTAEQAFSITVVSAVSSRSKGLTDQILIWPNPAKELIHISHLPSGVTIELISSSGSVIANYKPVDEYMTIPVSTFTPETYMLRVVEGMDVQTFKFIIER